MKYQVIEIKKPTPWWRWIPPFTFGSLFRFPYMVYATTSEYPWDGHVCQICSTKWGAKRLAKKISSNGRDTHDYVVVDEVKS